MSEARRELNRRERNGDENPSPVDSTPRTCLARACFPYEAWVMGGSRWLLLGFLLLGCGGASRDDHGSASGGAGGAADPPVPPASGGAQADPPPAFDPSNAGCQPSQWNCPVPTQCAFDGKGFLVPAECACDQTRPVDIVCGADEKIACLHATKDAHGTSIRDVHFGCRCVPRASTCKDCPDLFGTMDSVCIASSDDDSAVICGCTEVLPI